MAEKKLYWLKLKDDFFNQKEIKKLRRVAGGDTFTIIYLKLQLLSLKTNGIIEFSSVGDDLSGDLSYTIDEDRENIALTITFLKNHKLIEVGQNNDILISNIGELTGSEGGSAERQRKFKERQKLSTEALLSNSEVTNQSHIGNTKVTLDNKIIREEDNKIKEIISNDIIKRKNFQPPSLEEVILEFTEKGHPGIEAEKFYDYYCSNGWLVGKSKMKDWKAAVRNWIRNIKTNNSSKSKNEYEKQAEDSHANYDFGF